MLESLPLDVLNCILASLPDFDSLYSAIQLCKTIYNVFHTHPTSILHEVSLNVAGPALPDAMRLARRMADENAPGMPVLADDKDAPRYPTTRSEAILLVSNARDVQELELFFSRRHNLDRTSASNKLSESESYRFQRAIYRFWLYQERFGIEYLDSQYNVELWDPTVYSEGIEFLKHLPANEQCEFAAACVFLKDTCLWICEAYAWGDRREPLPSHKPTAADELMLCCSPSDILQCIKLLGRYTQEAAEDLLPPLVERDLMTAPGIDFIWHPLEHAGVDMSKIDYKVLLQETEGEKHTCSVCHDPSKQDLWNKGNWDLLYGAIPPRSLGTLLPGRLQWNLVDGNLFRQRTSLSGLDYPKFMQQMFDERPDKEDGFSEEAFICTGCLKSFMTSNLVSWWLHRKMEDGSAIQEDCWWGYHCKTQVHKFHHASRLNHFCKPARQAEV
ncbi:hypothetical protein DENSPDRAFT_769992 [Dentipellis sp. KUC8613]|nr:hypothetical protein DENSPDRAFT_769992 [Dentipellis sp. KUC8613]